MSKILECKVALVTMASILGQVATPQQSAYVAAKHGVIGLTKAAAEEYATRGICVNSVGPGYIDTPPLQDMTEEARAAIVAQRPVKRLGQADEVAELVVWISSDKRRLSPAPTIRSMAVCSLYKSCLAL